MNCNPRIVEGVKKKILNGVNLNNPELFLDNNNNPYQITVVEKVGIKCCIFDNNEFIIHLIDKYIKGETEIDSQALRMVGSMMILKYNEELELANINEYIFRIPGLLSDFGKKIKEHNYNTANHSNIETIIDGVKEGVIDECSYAEYMDEIDDLFDILDNFMSEEPNNTSEPNMSRPLGANNKKYNNKKSNNKKSKNKKSNNKKSKKNKK